MSDSADVSLGDAWRTLRGRGDFALREVACVGEARTLLVADLVPRSNAPWITLAGEQPDSAATWALLSIARDGLLCNGFAYRIWPSMYPNGETPRRGSPEFRAVATATRDRRFELGFELREGAGEAFVCECDARADGTGSCAAVTAALAEVGFSAGERAHAASAATPLLPRRTTDQTLTLTTPQNAAWNDRIAMHRIAVSAALAYMERRRAERT